MEEPWTRILHTIRKLENIRKKSIEKASTRRNKSIVRIKKDQKEKKEKKLHSKIKFLRNDSSFRRTILEELHIHFLDLP